MDKKKKAQSRWNILLQAVENQSISPQASVVSGFQSFGLFEQSEVDIPDQPDPETFQFVMYSSSKTKLLIKKRKKRSNISLKEIYADDNTGNIRVWPAEEVLAYFLITNPIVSNNIPKDKESIHAIEVGAGMSGFAAFSMFQMWSEISNLPLKLWITDGNDLCVEKINETIDVNTKEGYLDENMLKNTIFGTVLRWQDVKETFPDHEHYFDFIFAADCVFLDDYHDALISTLDYLLCEGGCFVLLAPSRSGARFKFTQKAKEYFDIEETQRYSEEIWEKHVHLLENIERTNYEPLQHYPSLLIFKRKIKE